MAKKQKELSIKHELFCFEYVRNGWHATNAYQTVYKCKRSTADTSWPALFGKTRISDRISELRSELVKDETEDTYGVIECYKEIREYGREKDDNWKKMVDAGSALKANDSLWKIAWVFKEDNEQKRQITVNNLAEFSTEELLQELQNNNT